ncbi:MAG: hypothetical protein CL610_18890 [Anaerolineaceae bacterium]|nr:hypothetical protein [Anaerolineaceae bacterium]
MEMLIIYAVIGALILIGILSDLGKGGDTSHDVSLTQERPKPERPWIRQRPDEDYYDWIRRTDRGRYDSMKYAQQEEQRRQHNGDD